jgi:hypothetical protein
MHEAKKLVDAAALAQLSGLEIVASNESTTWEKFQSIFDWIFPNRFTKFWILKPQRDEWKNEVMGGGGGGKGYLECEVGRHGADIAHHDACACVYVCGCMMSMCCACVYVCVCVMPVPVYMCVCVWWVCAVPVYVCVCVWWVCDVGTK